MKILFVTNTHELFPVIIGYFPLGIMQLGAVLKKAGHDVYYCGTSVKEVLHFIRENSIGIVAYSVMTGDELEYLPLNREIKKHFPNIFSVFGSSHPTFSTNIIEEEGVDVICRGEGTTAFPELIEKLSIGEDIRFLQNFWVKDGQKIYKNELRPLIKNISDLPFSDYDGYFQFVPRAGTMEKKIFISSLGCPFKCIYCSANSFNQIYKDKGSIYRNKTVDYLVKEILCVKSKYPLNWINFVDDVFGLSRDWLVEFSQEYPCRIGLPFSCIARLELVDEHYLKCLIKAGCQTILVGIETGDESVRFNILNRNMTNKLILDKVELIKKLGFRLLTFNMMGIPPGSIQSDWETVHFNQRIRPTYAYASIYQPLPGTRLRDLIMKKEISEIESLLKLRNFHMKSCINLKDKNKIENLHKFFSLVVAYPILELLVNWLLIFPLTTLYEIVRRFYGAFGFFSDISIKKSKIFFEEYCICNARFIKEKKYLMA